MPKTLIAITSIIILAALAFYLHDRSIPRATATIQIHPSEFLSGALGHGR